MFTDSSLPPPPVDKALAGAARSQPGRDVDTRGSHYTRWAKRAFDIAGATLLLAIFLPVLAVLLPVIAAQGGRPLYSHPREGRNGRTFRCVKIRTMVADADIRLKELLETDPAAAAEWARERKLRHDPRITRLGRLLRASSLDELPQLWNVIRGDMSLVGPRPVTSAELDLYGVSAAAYRRVRPGLTGLWQVSGRNDLSFEQRVDLDRLYLQRVSFALDLAILCRTVPEVLRLTGR